MAKLVTLQATYRIVTPMFLGGANQDPSDGIRPPSVKGALRFWWRALNWGRLRNSATGDAAALRELHKEEARLFGIAANDDSSGGQGSFLVRVQHGKLTSVPKGSVHPHFKPTRRRNGRREIDQNHLAAARYLGYGLMVAFKRTNRDTGITKYAGQVERGCLNENQDFTVKLIFRRGVETSVQEALIAWGLLGGLGSRSRHGIGSVALVSVKENGTEQWTAPTDEENYTAQIQSLFPSPVPPAIAQLLPTTLTPFSAFWNQSRIDRLLSGTDPYDVLDKFGKAMLMYRSWGQTRNGNVLPDGSVSEKRFRDDHDWSKVSGWRTANLIFHPKRVVFGLPHNYGKPDDQKVKADNHERRASPLLFHVHPIGDSFVGVSVYLPAQFLPDGEQINAGGTSVPANIDWSVITNFLDGKVGNPPPPGAADRFPSKKAVLP